MVVVFVLLAASLISGSYLLGEGNMVIDIKVLNIIYRVHIGGDIFISDIRYRAIYWEYVIISDIHI